MVAALKSRSLAALPVADPMHIRLTPLSQSVLRRGSAFRGVVRRDKVGVCPLAALKPGPGKGGPDEPFSLRDSETLGNIGVAGVLVTAIVVGGALVVFNPYAGQKVKQETIEVATVPKPLPSKKSSVPTPTAPFVPVKPAPPPVASKPAPNPPPVASKPAPTPVPPKPAERPAAQVAQGGSNTSLIGGLVIVAAVGGGVAYFTRSMGTENGVSATTAAEATNESKTAAAGGTPAEESPSDAPAAQADTGETKVTEAKEWIAEWRKSQE